MTTRTYAELRQDVAARIALLTGWTLADVPVDLHGPTAVPDAVPASRAHLSFAVGVQTSEPVGDRQRESEGTWCRSRVIVRFLSRLEPKDQLASYDDALGQEHTLLKQLLAVTATWPLHAKLVWEASSRSTVPSGEWFVHEVRLAAYHRLPLQ